MNMHELFLKMLNPSLYKRWNDVVSDRPTRDMRKGVGYYLPTGLIGLKNIGREEVWDMASGKRARVRLVDYSLFSDPDDMIKESWWQFLGYEGETPLAKMSFEEFLLFSQSQSNAVRGACLLR
jgi:hypothetical protein